MWCIKKLLFAQWFQLCFGFLIKLVSNHSKMDLQIGTYLQGNNSVTNQIDNYLKTVKAKV